MVKTASTMLDLGTFLPSFDLECVYGLTYFETSNILPAGRVAENSIGNKHVLIMIICAHCPFVKHLEHGISELDKDYGSEFQIIAVSSNSLITHPQDNKDNLFEQANKNNWKFPYLFDENQSFAKSIKAACTPDFFLFKNDENNQKSLVYRGQFDESRPGNQLAVTGIDLRKAMDKTLKGLKPNFEQKPSIGCNIKWHPGKEPSWYG